MGPAPDPTGTDVIDFCEFLMPGAGVWWGQAAAEPRPLVDALIVQSHRIGPIRTFTGLSWNDQLAITMPGRMSMVSYGGLGELRELSKVGTPGRGAVPLFGITANVRRTLAAVDVGLVQVSRPTKTGRALSASVSTTSPMQCATRRCSSPRSMPECRPRLAPNGFRSTDSRRPSPPTAHWPRIRPGAGCTEQRIAADVAELIDDGDTVQFGSRLAGRRGARCAGRARGLGISHRAWSPTA